MCVQKNSPCRGLLLLPRQRRQKILAGAKLTWEYVVDVGAYSSLIPGNGARKGLDAWLMTSPMGTPRGRCDEYSSKVFPQLRNQGMSIRRGETND
jgi:hypothetical protein